MKITELLAKELQLETLYTRRHLERVPMDKRDFKPHEKSMTLGWLATFTAILPNWGVTTLTQDAFDVTAPMPPEHMKVAETREELLALFDKNLAELRAALTRTTDAALDEPWALKAGPQVIFSQPRGLVYRTFIMNHMVHHRAQLGVFLRLLGVTVPAVYNDSADEKGGMFME